MKELKDLLPAFKRTSTLFDVQYPVGHCQRCGVKLKKCFKKQGWYCPSRKHKDDTFYLHL